MRCWRDRRFGTLFRCGEFAEAPAVQLGAALIEYIVSNLRDGTVLDTAIEKALAADDAKEPVHEQELARIEVEIMDVHKKIDRYLQAFETGAMGERGLSA